MTTTDVYEDTEVEERPPSGLPENSPSPGAVSHFLWSAQVLAAGRWLPVCR
ncbi:MAG: hypothetical protein R2789_01955 [Microthrixaceae bacterium]